ncbi:MAG: 3-deoxy-D-manno-octulosonic acid transferase, partial [Gammaproteobacteria bacterium]|nr:3-deoxy-D-manno-octulosonic acid transferase [Gammaproteobacteria bacterium]
QRNIPIIQVNARLSARSLEAPIFIRYLLRRAITAISLHLARSQQDRQALIELGAEGQNIKVLGNIKSYHEDGEPTCRLIERKYLLLASSHEGEEALFVKHRLEKWCDYLLVIAPRHPKRSAVIQKQLAHMGINLAVRSKHHDINLRTQVYLADTLGELKSFMAFADIVIMAGSFDKSGGHNIIEPAKL